ncbi:MAG: hypothetical protein M9928_06785 [Anaerolineae bacterium]|nr:hypothetical protein [Anaerolineae bacterium]
MYKKQFARIFLLLFALVIVISGAAEATRAQSPSFPTATELSQRGNDNQHTALSSSPFTPPDASDSLFVVDYGGGLDTGCTFADGSPLEIELNVTRYVGEVDGDGYLVNPNQLINDGILAPTITVMMPAYDIDYVSPDPDIPPERDLVQFNTSSLGFLTGSNNVWKLNTFQIPIDEIKFPEAAPRNASITPRTNLITVDIDILGGGWCTAIDWVAIKPASSDGLAWRPVLFAHGIFSNGSIWSNIWRPNLDALNIKNHAIDMGACDSIQNNSAEIGTEVAIMRDMYGVDKIHLVGHSKGGLDSRHYISGNDDVERLTQLASPNGGSPLADYAQGVAVWLLGGIPTALLDYFATPCGAQLTTPYMALYNLSDTPNPNTAYKTMAGDHDPGGWCAGSCILAGPDDTIVPVWSVHALPYAANLTHSADDGTATHSGIHGSTVVYNRLIGDLQQTSGPAAYVDSGWVPLSPRTADNPEASFRPRYQAAADQFLATQVGYVTAGEVMTHTVMVDPSIALSLQLVWGIDDLDLELTDPLGNHIDPSVASADPDMEFVASEAIEGMKSETYYIVNPVAGEWLVSVAGVSVSSVDGEGYGVSGYVTGSDVFLTVESDANYYPNGAPIAMTATLTETAGAVADATVYGRVALPDQTFTDIQLYDDGTHNDPTAGDGQYTHMFTDTLQSGAYSVQVVATRDTGAVFSREAGVLVTVAAGGSSFTGDFADRGVDDDGDGLYDELQVDVAVDVDSADTYRVTAQLRDSGETVIATGSMAGVLATGVQTVTLTFDGLTIFDNGVDGPYEIAQLALVEDGDPDLLMVDYMPVAYTTAPYLLTDFQRPDIFLTGISADSGIDTDTDGYYNQLDVSVEVDLKNADFYEWSAELVDGDGTVIDFDAQSGSLAAGLESITFTFDGAAIVDNRVDGPYYVKNLLMFGQSLGANLLKLDVATTAAYSIFEFDTDFVAEVRPAELSVCAPEDAVFDIDLGQLLGYTDPANLSVLDYPAGATPTFDVNPVTPPGRSVLTIGDTGSTLPGQYDMTVVIDGPISADTVDAALNLYDAAPEAVVTTFPADGAIDVAIAPELTWQTPVQADDYLIEIATDSAFADIVYSQSVTDTVHTVAIDLEPETHYYWHVRSENSCGTGAFGPTVSFTTLNSLLSTTPGGEEAWLDAGDVLTATMLMTNTGPIPLDYSLTLRHYTPPFTLPEALTAPIQHSADPAIHPSLGLAPSQARSTVPAGSAINATPVVGSAALSVDLLAQVAAYLEVDDPSGVYVVGSTPGSFFGGDLVYDGDFDTLYAVDAGSNFLYAVDTQTGVATAVGAMTPVTGQTWTGMSADAATQTMYAASSDCVTSTLYTVDLATGAVTLIGSDASGYCVIDIAISPDGVLFGLDIITDQLVTIDLATGAISPLGSLGFDANYAQGMDFDDSTGVLYLAAYNGGTGLPELHTADTVTGASTLIGTLAANELDAFAIATTNWVRALPAIGTIPPDSTDAIEVVLDTRDLPATVELSTTDISADMQFAGSYFNTVNDKPFTVHLDCVTCGAVDGAITDDVTGLPLQALVKASNATGYEFLVNVENYALNLPPDTYLLTVSAPGYVAEQASVSVTTGVTTTTDFALTPDDPTALALLSADADGHALQVTYLAFTLILVLTVFAILLSAGNRMSQHRSSPIR